MKTLHRLMYENLTPEEWKEFCKCNNIEDLLEKDYSFEKPSNALNGCMFWDEQPQKHDYWNSVYSRLRKLNK